MAVTTVGTTARSVASLTSIALTTPTGVASGDVLIACWGLNPGGGTWTLPSGWTRTFVYTTAGVTLALDWKVAGASEPGSYTWTISTSHDGAAGIIALRGVDNTTPILGKSAENDFDTVTAITMNSVAWSGAADAVSLLLLTWQSVTATVTWPSGWNGSPDGLTQNDAFEWLAVGCNLTTVSAVTSLPSKTVTLGHTEYGEAAQVAIKVASGGASDPFPLVYPVIGTQGQNAVYRI